MTTGSQAAISVPSQRLGLLWLWCAVAIAFIVWGTNPFVRYDGTDVFDFFLTWVWFAGPTIALALSLVLAFVRPAALPLVRSFCLAHMGSSVALSVVAVSIRWNQTATEMTFLLMSTVIVGVL